MQPPVAVSSNKSSEFKLAYSAVAAEKTILLPTAVIKFTCGSILGTMYILLHNCSQVTVYLYQIRLFGSGG